MFTREFVPESLRDAWRTAFKQLRQGAMTVLEYAIWFSDLSRHAPNLVAMVRERVHQFIEGLNPGIKFIMARELEMDIPYQQVVDISMRLKGMCAREREVREAKRPRDSRTYSSSRAPVAVRHGRGYVSRPIHSTLLASSDIPATPMPPVPHYALPLSSAPTTQGAFSGQSSRPGPSQSQQPRPSGAYFECGGTHHIVRDCPRIRRGAPPQTT
ncbi:uncharacterized protein [Nicotiana tomentosiformis]|uniref:uncharacterized protein n=1 Tax=Nicotiana tomentosiformis TaxID=4098 RepID=UPI00388CA0A6